MNKKQAGNINELCEIYHRPNFDHQVDAAAFTLLLSLLYVAPIGDVPPTLQDSIKTFREISHQERYSFTMMAISTLLGSPSSNLALKNMFERIVVNVEPVVDNLGKTVLQRGRLNFGPFKDTTLGPLIFASNLCAQ